MEKMGVSLMETVPYRDLICQHNSNGYGETIAAKISHSLKRSCVVLNGEERKGSSVTAI